jgi:hypothetical protein
MGPWGAFGENDQFRMSKSKPTNSGDTPSADDLANFSQALSQSTGGDTTSLEPRDIDMRIARDGTWFYHGSAIRRKPLVRLFSTVIRREDDGDYYLVTPVERCRIQVDDAPFTAVEMFVEGQGEDQSLSFRTNVDEVVRLDDDHPLRLVIDAESGEPAPYIRVRDNLDALVVRPVYYDLVDLAVEKPPAPSDRASAPEDGDIIGVWSGGRYFELGRIDEGDAG